MGRQEAQHLGLASVSERTLKRMAARYAEHGPIGMADGRRPPAVRVVGGRGGDGLGQGGGQPAGAGSGAGDIPVLVDGGIRTGTGALTALALGADAVLTGRPVLWALTVRGREGVRSLFDSYRTELAEAMALVGARSPEKIGFDLVAPGS
ncbi:alpha-hydroxy-acid oxidizing protein [Streptomyces sp. ISL-66]|nr:alpha-hydroxy-acid oxidizing protein [Streptomyces sp. ISL-66]